MEKQADDYTLTGPYQLRNIKMENVLKQIELPKEVIEVQDAIQQVAEPESGGLGGGEIAVIVIIAAGALGLLAKKFCKK